MKYNQNHKINQVTEQTLVVGVDIAKEYQYARAFDYRGIELDKVFKFRNDREGFEIFVNWCQNTMKNQGKTRMIVGMEPTGHYWLTLSQYLEEHPIKVVLVNPFHVKRSKELDDNNPTKNDRKDPKTIAMLIKDGRYMEPYIPEGIYAELRTAISIREQLTKELCRVKNRVERWLDMRFPEFKNVFSDWEGKAALLTLKTFPMPNQVVETGAEQILATWRKEVKRSVGIKRANKLVSNAKKSIGIKTASQMAVRELETLMEQYELLMGQLITVETDLEVMSKKIQGVEEAAQTQGLGIITIAGFLAETGELARFEHTKQIQKLAGLNLKENSSGKHKGETKITKRGRKRLRALLFRAILPLTAKNEQFRELHKYYTTREKNPLKKMQSLTLLCCKLIRILYTMIIKQVKYDGEKMMNDIKRPALQEAA